MLSWIILPFVQGYMESKFSTPRSRLSDSFYKNLRYYLLLTFLTCVVIAYLRFALRTMSFSNFKELVISLTYFWGLLFVIFLLGNGFVYVPVSMWKKAFITKRAALLERQAVGVYSKLQARLESYSLPSSSISLNNGRNQSSSDFFTSSLTDHAFNPHSSPNGMSNVIALQTTWNQMVKEYNRIMLIKTAKASGSYRLYLPDSYIPIHPVVAYAFYVWILPAFRILFSIFMASMSVIIVVSEVFLHTQYSLVGIILQKFTNSSATSIFVSFLFVYYMRYCTYKSLMRTQFAPHYYYALVPFRATNTASLIYFASQLCRLTLPLCYNFVSLQPYPTQFHQFYGESIDLLPLGNLISKRYPTFILLPIIFSMISLKYRLRQFIYSITLRKSSSASSSDDFDDSSLNSENDDDLFNETSAAYLAEGRALLLGTNNAHV